MPKASEKIMWSRALLAVAARMACCSAAVRVGGRGGAWDKSGEVGEEVKV